MKKLSKKMSTGVDSVKNIAYCNSTIENLFVEVDSLLRRQRPRKRDFETNENTKR